MKAVESAGGRTGGGKKGVAGEKGSVAVFRCTSGRRFGTKNPWFAPECGLALMKLVFAARFHHCLSPGEPGRGAARKLLSR